jgi:hypothetical protein
VPRRTAKTGWKNKETAHQLMDSITQRQTLKYVLRNEGIRGLILLEEACIVEVMILIEYVDRNEDPQILIVSTLQQHNTKTELCYRQLEA